MATQDTCCSIHPYFKIPDGQHDTVKAMCEQFIELTSQEPGCLYYGFSVDGDQLHCREAYRDADALLAHLGNVGGLLQQLLTIVEVLRLEVHGPAFELDKLRGPLGAFGPQFFTLEYGFRN